MRAICTLFFAMLLACEPGARLGDRTPDKGRSKTTPKDESQRFPRHEFVESKLVSRELMGKRFMPGGTLAVYRRGETEYEMFLANAGSAVEAAVLLPDWQRTLTGAKLIPSFGGYFGRDGDREMFVFSIGPWIAGIAGLSEKDADRVARLFAAKLNDPSAR